MATYVIGDVHGRLALLDQLVRDVPWDVERDKIVFVGDLIDRGPDSRGVIDRLLELKARNSEMVVLRGNHEQMMLDCLDYGDFQWLIPENGGLATLESYGLHLSELRDVSDIKIPQEHINFVRGLSPVHEDESAIYVHAGLVIGRELSDTPTETLMWTRDAHFYKYYTGKLCFFGHTPTQFLPKEGRNGRYGIYIHGSCVGIDTSGDEGSPLSCVRTDTFTVYQAFPSGITQAERYAHPVPSPVAESA
ncbi:MAG TPA: metallophosphoesterase family protein [Blastocatellia bacterium]|nr:metallophosphoesterase family protein [Blastocatellia bacterium]